VQVAAVYPTPVRPYSHIVPVYQQLANSNLTVN
jgi:hypothetical protein